MSKKPSPAMVRRLKKLVAAPAGGTSCIAFEGHGYEACLSLVELGLAVEVGKHGLGAAFQITPEGERFLQSEEAK